MSWFRLLVLWIAMIAVPFQAHAAATMPACGPAHGVTAEVAEVDGHAGHAEHARHDRGDSRSPDPASDPAHQCATCGACHATALTDMFSAVVLHDLPPADLAEPSFAMATCTSRVPDRPPRA